MPVFIVRRASRDRTVGSQSTMALRGRNKAKTDIMKTTSTILLSAVALTASAFLATAQDAPPQDRGDRGNRGGTPEEFRARMEERIKTSLKSHQRRMGRA